MIPLRNILDEAADRYDFISPFQRIKTLKVPWTNVEPFTLEEVKCFLNHIRQNFKSYYTVWFFTGMRTGEIDGLKWKYADFRKQQILVRETYVKGFGPFSIRGAAGQPGTAFSANKAPRTVK